MEGVGEDGLDCVIGYCDGGEVGLLDLAEVGVVEDVSADLGGGLDGTDSYAELVGEGAVHGNYFWVKRGGGEMGLNLREMMVCFALVNQ